MGRRDPGAWDDILLAAALLALLIIRTVGVG